MSDAAFTIDRILCPSCGYDLRAIESERCPECGTAIDRSQLGKSVIPWLHREQVGRWSAFRRTVRLATFRPRELALEINCPARFRDAVLFRRRVVLLALVPWGLLVTVAYLITLHAGPGGVWASDDRFGSFLQLCLIPVFWLALALFLFVVTGLASYFFHPKSIPIVQQNRAITISYYACAPLAYTPLTLPVGAGGLVLGGILVDSNSAGIWPGLIWTIAFAPIGLQLFMMLRLPIVMLRATTHCGALRQWCAGILLPILWLISAGFFLFALPLAALALIVMAVSLRH